MSENIQENMSLKLYMSDMFTLQIDGSTDITNNPLSNAISDGNLTHFSSNSSPLFPQLV